MKSIILKKLKNIIFYLFFRKRVGVIHLYRRNLLKSIIRDSIMSLLILFVSMSLYLIHKEIKNG